MSNPLHPSTPTRPAVAIDCEWTATILAEDSPCGVAVNITSSGEHRMKAAALQALRSIANDEDPGAICMLLLLEWERAISAGAIGK